MDVIDQLDVLAFETPVRVFCSYDYVLYLLVFGLVCQTYTSSSGITVLGGPQPLLQFQKLLNETYFLWGGVVSPKPKSQTGGPGYPFLSWSSLFTCLAWEALPITMLLPIQLSGSFDHASPTTMSNLRILSGVWAYTVLHILVVSLRKPVLIALQCNTWVCSHLTAGITCLNPAEGMMFVSCVCYMFCMQQHDCNIQKIWQCTH